MLANTGVSRLFAAQLKMAGDTPTPAMDMTVTYPQLSPRGNNLLYLTHVATSPQVPTRTNTHTHAGVGGGCNRYVSRHACLSSALQVRCEASLWLDRDKINRVVVFPNPLKETLSDFLLVSSPLTTWLRVPVS